MTLKQFLKPDWRKIVLMIIILLIAPIPNFSYYVFPNSNGSRICNITMRFPNGTEINTTGPCPLSTPLVYPAPNLIFLLFSPPNLISNAIENPLTFIIFVIISYLLSCFLAWLYDRFKNIKTKK